MSKKDRIEIVITGIFFVIGLAGITDGGILAILIGLIYWGYRFIKNDISFLNKNGDL